MTDYSNLALTYGLLLLPSLFALAVIGQGLVKMKKQEASGKLIVLMGVIFLSLVPAAYFLFIRI
jgi:hypothetical protein